MDGEYALFSRAARSLNECLLLRCPCCPNALVRLDRNPWEFIQPIRVAYSVATNSTTAELTPSTSSRTTEGEAYPPSSLLLPYQKMAVLEQQWRRVLFNLGELRKQEDDCTQFETSVDTLVEQMEDALELPSALPFHVLREPMCRRLGGLLILRNHRECACSPLAIP